MKYISGVTDGKALVVRGTSDTKSEKEGVLRNGDRVAVLGTDGESTLVGTGTCGWVPERYLSDEPPEADRLEYTMKDYSGTVVVTEKDAAKRVGERHTVGWLLLRDDLGEQLISPSMVELIEAAEVSFCGTAEFPTGNSLFRTAKSNRDAGGASSSLHLKGIAADFRIKREDGYVERGALALWVEAYMHKRGWAGGVGVYSGTSEHVHADLRGRWTFWWRRTSGSDTPGFGGRPVTFARGHRSSAIVLIQERLNADGFDAGKADGVFGARTERALSAWQKARGLEADGRYGVKTNMAMGLFDW